MKWLIFVMNNFQYTNEYLYKSSKERISIIHDLWLFMAPCSHEASKQTSFHIESLFVLPRMEIVPAFTFARLFEILISSLRFKTVAESKGRAGAKRGGKPNRIISVFVGISLWLGESFLFWVYPFFCVH